MEEILKNLEKLVGKEIDKIVAKGDITPSELEMATKAVCLIEKIKMVDELDSGSSYRRGSRSYNSYENSYGRDYGRDRSYDYYPMMDKGYVGYSGHSVKDRMISHLESTMMDGAKSESEKRTIEALINQLSNS